jgi:hypothetical protein
MFSSFKSCVCVFAIAAVMVGVPLGLMAAPAGADAGGNSAAADACHQGGYQGVARLDGTTFASVGDCVAYAAQGGTLFASGAAQHVCESLGGTFGDTDLTGEFHTSVLFSCNDISPATTADWFNNDLPQLGAACPEESVGALFGTPPAAMGDFTCGIP